MKYVPRELGEAAENSSGGGRRGLLKEIAVLTTLTVLAMGGLYLLAGLITDFAVSHISPEDERILFKHFTQERFDSTAPEAMATKWAEAQRILAKLVQYEAVVDLDYRLAYSPEPRPNAFAIPGGTIVLTQGLLDDMDEEIAMAFVIAHELGHFAGRDHLQSLGRQVGFGTALTLLTGGKPDGLLNAASQLMALNYSRQQESAADQFGITCLDAVYGHRQGAERLFEILDASDKIPDWAYMFLTHPANAKRIQSIQRAPEPLR